MFVAAVKAGAIMAQLSLILGAVIILRSGMATVIFMEHKGEGGGGGQGVATTRPAACARASPTSAPLPGTDESENGLALDLSEHEIDEANKANEIIANELSTYAWQLTVVAFISFVLNVSQVRG